MAGETSAHPARLMGAAPLLIQLPHDRLISQRRFDRHPRSKLMARQAGIRPGREKDKLTVWIIACLLGDLSQGPAMFRVAACTGRLPCDQIPVPATARRSGAGLERSF